MPEDATTTETENQVDYSTINYDSVVENCLSDPVKKTLPKSWSKFKGKPMDEVFTAHLNAEQELSRRLRVPDENSSEIERRKFHTQLGCPEAPEGYDFGDISIESDPDFMKWVRESFHAVGMSQAKAKQVVQRFANRLADQQRKNKEADAQALKEAEKDLKSRPGWEGENYDKRLAVAQRWYDRLFGDGAARIFAEKGINTHPMVVANVYALADQLGEDFFAGANRTGPAKSAQKSLEERFPDKR